MMALVKLKGSSWTSIIGMMIENVHIGLCDGSDKKERSKLDFHDGFGERKGSGWTSMIELVKGKGPS